MKLNKTLLVAMLGMGIASSANAVNLNITGTIDSPACTVGAAAPDIDIDMFTVDAATIVTGSPVASRRVRLPIVCTAGANIGIVVTGIPDRSDSRLLKLTTTGTEAKGVAVGFYDAGNNLIELRSPSAAIAATNATTFFEFAVAYVGTGPTVTNGDANATAQIDVVTF